MVFVTEVEERVNVVEEVEVGVDFSILSCPP
jgi:hypothetical protein